MTKIEKKVYLNYIVDVLDGLKAKCSPIHLITNDIFFFKELTPKGKQPI